MLPVPYYYVTLAAAALALAIGCGGDNYPTESTLRQIAQLQDDLHEHGISSVYPGGILGENVVGIGIYRNSATIPVETIREVPISVDVSFIGRDILVEDIQALAQLPNLISLRFIESQLSPDVFGELSSLANVSTLSLTDCHIEVDGVIALPPKTRVLELINLDAADILLSSLEVMTNVEFVDLTGSSIGAKGMSQLGMAHNVRVLFLTETQVDDDAVSYDYIATYIAGMTNLRRLELNGTNITDNGVRRLSGLQSLEHLGLRRTRVTNDSVAVLSDLPELGILSVTDTELDATMIIEERRKKCPSSLLLVN